MSEKSPLQWVQATVQETVTGVITDPTGTARKALGQARGVVSLGLTVGGHLASQVAELLGGRASETASPWPAAVPSRPDAESGHDGSAAGDPVAPTPLRRPATGTEPTPPTPPTPADVARAATKKAATKAPVTKAAATKAAAKKAPAKKTVAGSTPSAKLPPAKKAAPAKKSAPVKKAPVKKATPAPAEAPTPADTALAKKAVPAKKTVAKKAAAKKAAATKTAPAAPAKKAAVKKAPVKKTTRTAAEVLEDTSVTTPVGTTGADVATNPSTAETDLQQPGTEPLMDPGTTKAIASEAATLARAADPDKG